LRGKSGLRAERPAAFRPAHGAAILIEMETGSTPDVIEGRAETP